jgi:signal transduction histidine kinase
VLAATGRSATDFQATLLDKPLFDPIRRLVAEFLAAEYALYRASRRRIEVLATVHLIVLLVSLGVAAAMLPRLRSSLVSQTSDLESLFEELYEMNERLLAAVKEREAAGKEVRKLNEDLARRLDELTRANAELEAFSYSISHDLRTPLRSFDGYSQILLEDYGDRLDETARQYLQRMRVNSHRMAQLIDDLLDLSRVGRGELARERVDLTAVAHEILGDLQRANPEREVRAAVAHGLTATGDPRLLRLVMQNLLDNAWKFTAGTDGAEIAVDAREEGEGRAYFVRDTGVGFDMAFVDKLFGPFQRLHGTEFPGSGVGLAIVKRIVERHGGRVWAEASPGRGATFYFTVPTPATP